MATVGIRGEALAAHNLLFGNFETVNHSLRHPPTTVNKTKFSMQILACSRRGWRPPTGRNELHVQQSQAV